MAKAYEWDDAKRAELANLWHLSKTALALDPKRRSSEYERQLWASEEYAKAHPGCSPTSAYKELDRQMAWREVGRRT
jgi:hypothetical protein